MPAKKKANAVDNLNARLSLVVKSGKISLGHRTTVKALRKSQGGSSQGRFSPPLRGRFGRAALDGYAAPRSRAQLVFVQRGRPANPCAFLPLRVCSQAGADRQQLPAGASARRRSRAFQRAAAQRSSPTRQHSAAVPTDSAFCSQLRKSEIEYYCMLAKVMVVPYNGNNIDMGTAVGKFYRVSAMTIIDAGDSDILKVSAGEKAEKA